jgi:hypothetical protein
MQENLGPDLKVHYLSEHEAIRGQGGKLLEQATEYISFLERTATDWDHVKGRKIEIQRNIEDLSKQTLHIASSLSIENHDLQFKQLLDIKQKLLNVRLQLLQLEDSLSSLTRVVKSPELASMLTDMKNEHAALESNCLVQTEKIKKLSNVWHQYVSLYEAIQNWLHNSEQIPFTSKYFDLLDAEIILYEEKLKDSDCLLEKAIEMLPSSDETLQKQLHSQLQSRFNDLKTKHQSFFIDANLSKDYFQIVEETQRLLTTANDFNKKQAGKEEQKSKDQLQESMSKVHHLISCLTQQVAKIQTLMGEETENAEKVLNLGELAKETEAELTNLQQVLDGQADLLFIRSNLESLLFTLCQDIKELEDSVANNSTSLMGSLGQMAMLRELVKVNKVKILIVYQASSWLTDQADGCKGRVIPLLTK